MIRTQVYFPDDMYHELKLLTVTGGEKFSDLIRQGVRKVLEEKKKRKKRAFDPWKDFVGIIKGGPKDLSSKIDYYLYDEPYRIKSK